MFFYTQGPPPDVGTTAFVPTENELKRKIGLSAIRRGRRRSARYHTPPAPRQHRELPMDGPSYVMDSLDSQSGEPLAQALRQRLQEVEALQDNNPAYVIDSLDSQSGEPLALALQAHAAANEAVIGK